MILHDKVWRYRNKETDLSSDLGEFSVVAKTLLKRRNIDTQDKARKFLFPEIEDLYDPMMLDSMNKAVMRIKNALESGESIWIFGDYDVDGITSTSLLIKSFRALGYEVNYYIPDRKKEGYGINEAALSTIKENGGDLVITVDCGITSVKEVKHGQDIGLDIIVTDHHECQEEIPNAYAVINPKKDDCDYPFDMLAGVGIALKLAHGLLEDNFYNVCDELLDLAALGTIADIAPLNDENRVISKLGLELVNSYTNLGISSLIEASGLADKEVTAGHIGFVIAPKINAAGRIGSAKDAVELLTTDDPDKATILANKLCDLNDKRQSIEKDILDEAIDYIEKNIDLENENILVVQGFDWHTGIIGIVASRISERYYKPTVILNIEEGIAKGSARSVGSFSIFDALSSCKDLFIKFGGHEQAAGLSLPEENTAELRRRINIYANENLGEYDLIPVVNIDEKLKSSDITYKLIDELSLFEPYGVGNPKPVFSYENLFVDTTRLLGKSQEHLKITVHDQNRIFDCLGFGLGEKYSYFRSNDVVNMAFTLEKNNFRGVETIQFMIKDIKGLTLDNERKAELDELYRFNLYKYISSYDGDGEIKGNLFSNENFIDKDELINMLSGEEKLNIYVNSLEGIKEFYLNFFDGYFKDMHINWGNDKSDNKDKKITVNILSTKFHSDGANIVYDIPLNLLTQKDNNHNFKVLRTDTKNLAGTEMIRAGIPDREDLKNIYLYLKQNQNLCINLNTACKTTNINNLKMLLSLSLMKSIGLISGDISKNEICFKLENVTSKINIAQSEEYSRLVKFKEEYFKIITMLKDVF